MARLRLLVRQFDWLLFGATSLVIVVSLALLYSVAIGREGGNLSIFWKQLAIAAVGLVALFAVSSINFHTWQGISRWLYWFMLAVLFIVLIVGHTVNATRGWLSFGGWQLQPVEFAKVITIIALASYFSRRARELNRLPNLLQSFVIIVGIVGLVLLQPDFGSAAVIFAVWVSLLLTIGVRREYLLGMLVIGVGGFLLGWFFLFKPYQKERLITFFFPTERSATQSYNVRQAIIAVGSGEVTGRGLGQGSQSQLRFLPEASTDFIFAVLGEELGFAGVALLFVLFAIIYYRLFRLLFRCRDEFASFVILGTLLLITIEIFVNAGMNMGLFPVVGIPFPFLSAGGSAMLAHLILIGIIENVARFEGASGYRVSQVSTL